MSRHRRGHAGRHRFGLPGLVHCALLPAVALRMAWRAGGWEATRHHGRQLLVSTVRPVPPVAAPSRPAWADADRLAA